MRTLNGPSDSRIPCFHRIVKLCRNEKIPQEIINLVVKTQW